MAATPDTRVRYLASDRATREFLDGRADFTLVDDAPDVVVGNADTPVHGDVPTVTGPSADADGDALAALADAIRRAATRTNLPYPTKADESERLAATRSYDTTDPTLTAHLDALAVAVRASLDASASLIGLIEEDVEHLVATDGFDAVTVPREHSICRYGVLSDAPLVVADVDADDRFDPSENGVDLDLRSYAGAPIMSPDGYCLGMVCVVGDEPRTFDGSETDALSWFSNEVVRHLEAYGR